MFRQIVLALLATVCLSDNLSAQQIIFQPAVNGNCNNVKLEVKLAQPAQITFIENGVVKQIAASPTQVVYTNGYPVFPTSVSATPCKGARIDPVLPVYPVRPLLIYAPPPPLKARIGTFIGTELVNHDAHIAIMEAQTAIYDIDNEIYWKIHHDSEEQFVPHYIARGEVTITGIVSENDKKQFLTLEWHRNGIKKTALFVRDKTRR